MAKKWVHSASQIETFRSCQRKWGYRYIDRINPPPSKAAQLGSLVHTMLEKYLIENNVDTASPLWKIIEPGLGFLPHGLKKNHVEKHFSFTEDDLFFHGFIDFYQDLGRKTWLIGDHKTCSSFTYSLSEEDLKKDVQANIYARWAFNNLSADKVNLRWIYYQTKPKNQARCVEAQIESQENLDHCRSILHQPKKSTRSSIQRKNQSLCPKTSAHVLSTVPALILRCAKTTSKS